MPTLDWIGKAAVVNHHRKVGYHLLRRDRALSAGDADAGNLLVQGDNLLAANSCIFIMSKDRDFNAIHDSHWRIFGRKPSQAHDR